MFSVTSILALKTVLAYLQIAASQNATAAYMMQPDIASSSLTGAYRAAEVGEVSYHMATKDPICSGAFTKYVVSIRKLENEKNFGHRHICGGVIIRSNLILTAAHCMMSNKQVLKPTSIRVVARTPIRLRKTPETQVIKVQEIIMHKLFSVSHNVDIALLKLREHIKLDKSCAAVVNVTEKRINDSTMCVVLGWGKLYLNGPLANEILQLNVTLHSKEFCEPFFLNTHTSKLCASDSMNNENHPCSGDSGGPLLCEGVLTGILSYGFKRNYFLPTVYTDVYEHRNWIIENNGDILQNLRIIYFLLIAVLLMSK